MALFSIVKYNGNGTNKEFVIPYSIYPTISTLKVYLNGVEQAGNTYKIADTNDKVVFNTAPASGVQVSVERITDASKMKVDFKSGAILKETDLDNAFLQLLAIAQENNDDINERYTVDETEPAFPKDGYIWHKKSTTTTYMYDGSAWIDLHLNASQAASEAEGFKDDAEAAATAAQKSEDNAKASETSAGNSLTAFQNRYKEQPTAPTPTKGLLWFDTTNNVLKVYTGTKWLEVKDGEVTPTEFLTLLDQVATAPVRFSGQKLQQYNGTTWVDITNIGSGHIDLSAYATKVFVAGENAKQDTAINDKVSKDKLKLENLLDFNDSHKSGGAVVTAVDGKKAKWDYPRRLGVEFVNADGGISHGVMNFMSITNTDKRTYQLEPGDFTGEVTELDLTKWFAPGSGNTPKDIQIDFYNASGTKTGGFVVPYKKYNQSRIQFMWDGSTHAETRVQHDFSKAWETKDPNNWKHIDKSWYAYGTPTLSIASSSGWDGDTRLQVVLDNESTYTILQFPRGGMSYDTKTGRVWGGGTDITATLPFPDKALSNLNQQGVDAIKNIVMATPTHGDDHSDKQVFKAANLDKTDPFDIANATWFAPLNIIKSTYRAGNTITNYQIFAKSPTFIKQDSTNYSTVIYGVMVKKGDVLDYDANAQEMRKYQDLNKNYGFKVNSGGKTHTYYSGENWGTIHDTDIHFYDLDKEYKETLADGSTITYDRVVYMSSVIEAQLHNKEKRIQPRLDMIMPDTSTEPLPFFMVAQTGSRTQNVNIFAPVTDANTYDKPTIDAKLKLLRTIADSYSQAQITNFLNGKADKSDLTGYGKKDLSNVPNANFKNKMDTVNPNGIYATNYNVLGWTVKSNDDSQAVLLTSQKYVSDELKKKIDNTSAKYPDDIASISNGKLYDKNNNEISTGGGGGMSGTVDYLYGTESQFNVSYSALPKVGSYTNLTLTYNMSDYRMITVWLGEQEAFSSSSVQPSWMPTTFVIYTSSNNAIYFSILNHQSQYFYMQTYYQGGAWNNGLRTTHMNKALPIIVTGLK